MGVVERNGTDGVDRVLACVSQVWAGSHTTRQGWPGPGWPGLAWPEARSVRRGDGTWFGDVEAAEAPDSGAVW